MGQYFLQGYDFSLWKKDDCKTRKDTEYCIAKQGPNINPLRQWEQKSTTNQQQQNHRLRTDSSQNHWGRSWMGGGVNVLDWPNPRPRFCCW